MVNKGQGKPKKRLNNAEFLELIPHLHLEELFLIQIMAKRNWSNMFMYLPKTEVINCHICKEKLTLASFMNHIIGSTHKTALLNVEQFYHPVYTYEKRDTKLAKGEVVSESELNTALEKANSSLALLRDGDWMMAKHICRKIKATCGLSVSGFEETLISLALKTDVKSAHDIIVEVGLPLQELLKLQFCVKPNEWKPMLTTDNPHPSGKYLCQMCVKQCHGIITVNSHINGFQHKNLQLESIGMRLANRNNLTKYCGYRFDKNYSLTIKREGRERLKGEVQRILKDRAKKQIGTDKVQRQGTELTEVKSENNNDKVINIESSDSFNAQNVRTNKASSDDIGHTSASGEQPLPKLSGAVAFKAKQLAAEKPQIAEEVLDVDDEIDKEGLIGVEYVVKLLKCPNDPAPEYECTLCEVVANEARMQSHLINHNHRIKYCEMHYPHTVQAYKERIGHVKFSEYFRMMSFVLSKLSSRIEKHHGRSIPFTIPLNKFTKMRPEIISRIYNFKHACEKHGPNFLIVSNKKDFMSVKLGKSIYQPPMVPSNHRGRFTTVPTDKIYLNQRHHDPNILDEPITSTTSAVPSRPPVDRSSSPQVSNTQKSIPARNIWRVYRDEISTAASAVERSYVEYRRHPESHPSYDQEWNRFWRRRKDQLVAQGIEHRSYNYQPEWVHYFRERLEELFGEDLQRSKEDVRRRLNIPLDAEEDSNPQNILPPFSNAYKRPIQETQEYSEITENVVKKRRLSPDNLNRQFNLPQVVEDDKPNVIHTLRLLTALEDHLGSLGNKVMELLSKSLVLEKTSGSKRELDQQILTANNCTLIETAMEKLKGILYADLLEPAKVTGFNRVIDHAINTLNYADKMGWRNSSSSFPEKSNTASDIQQLIEVLQSKQNNNGPSTTQKSLSDTLMKLISVQKGDTLEHISVKTQNQRNNNKSINLMDDSRDRSLSFDRSNFGESMGVYKPLNPLYNNAHNHGMSQGNISNFNLQRLNSNSNNSQFQKIESNQFPLSGFNTNFSRNAPQNFSRMDKPGGSAPHFGNDTGNGRNNFNNLNYNKNNNNDNIANSFESLKPSNNNSAMFRGTNQGSAGFQGPNNFPQMSSMGPGTNLYQNSMGTGGRSNHWNRFPNNQWS